MKDLISEIDFEKSGGLITAIAQDKISKKVLMIAFQNHQALKKSIETGFAHYFSRSRNKIWKKGEESGNTQEIYEIYYDCDKDAILMLVKQKGPACHTGSETCFTDRFIPSVNERVKKSAEILWLGFNFLNNKKYEEISKTSKILLSKNLLLINKKIKEEKQEVVGVIDGTHMHGNLEDDAILESAQFFYWKALKSILKEESFEKFFKDFFNIENPVFDLNKKARLPLWKFLERDVEELGKKPYSKELFKKIQK